MLSPIVDLGESKVEGVDFALDHVIEGLRR